MVVAGGGRGWSTEGQEAPPPPPPPLAPPPRLRQAQTPSLLPPLHAACALTKSACFTASRCHRLERLPKRVIAGGGCCTWFRRAQC